MTQVVNVQIVSRIYFIEEGGYSLTGKTAILHIVILGSSPDNSIVFSLRSSIGRADH